MLSFLHLSDLHITTSDAGSEFDFDEKIRDAMMADLGRDSRTKFSAIFVTGDIAYHGSTAEFTRAKKWLEELRQKTEVAPESVFVIPGNHDVNRTNVSTDSSLWDLHQRLRGISDQQERQLSLNKKLQDPFDFLTGQIEYRAFAVEYGCPTTPKSLAWVHVLDEKHLLEDGTAVRVHGLNSAILSDGQDKKANLTLGKTQFHHFNSNPGYVNIVLCHHPHSWLLDGNEANDFFRKQAHVVLSGHEHDARIYPEGGSLRVFAGAVHPNPRESKWEPCYHILNLAIKGKNDSRVLVATVETRVWLEKEKCFGKCAGESIHEEQIKLSAWTRPSPPDSRSPPCNRPLSSTEVISVARKLSDDEYGAARRKLIVHFFRLGTVARYKVVTDAGVWEEGDDALDGQARWARVFERAEKSNKLGALWKAVAIEDGTLAGQLNPFEEHP